MLYEVITDRPLGLAFRRLFPFLFSGPGYGSLVLGTPESIETMTPAEARAFWQRQRGLPFVISACGDFDRDAVLTLAKRLRGAIGQPTAFAQPAPVWNDARSETLKLPGRNQVHLLKIFRAPALTAPDSPALAVLKEVLSGQSGLLFRELRDNRITSYNVCYTKLLRCPWPWAGSATTWASARASSSSAGSCSPSSPWRGGCRERLPKAELPNTAPPP